MYELVSAGEMNNAGNFRGSVYPAITNGVTSLDSITIQGSMGAEYIEISDYSSAKEIADAVNAKSDLTGERQVLMPKFTIYQEPGKCHLIFMVLQKFLSVLRLNLPVI